ncbi:MAG: hypothetical protein IPJ65_12310 [Archangiaceae bacterium]|nr:hypothetical protein [Archangiaceae bacterium]
MLTLLATLHLAAAASGGATQLSAAEAACYQLDYAGCLELLQKAKAEPNNSRATLLRILELEGVTAAQLKQPMRAQDALRTLFLLDRDHKLTGNYAPRVNTEILEAKAWARANGVLELTTEAPKLGPTAVESLGVTLAKNPLGIARAVKVYQRAPGAQAKVTELKADPTAHRVAAKGAVIEWWVQVLGANDAVLLEVGSEQAPLIAKVEAQVVVEAPVARAVEPVVSLDEAPPGPRFRPAAWTLVALGAVSAGVGVYFAASTAGARSQLENPMRNADGWVTNRTQVQAMALESSMRRDAWVANGLFAAAGALALTGLILFIAGRAP